MGRTFSSSKNHLKTAIFVGNVFFKVQSSMRLNGFGKVVFWDSEIVCKVWHESMIRDLHLLVIRHLKKILCNVFRKDHEDSF